MLQAAPPFSPFQLLEAARRAEAEGHIDAAYQYYRQRVDQYAYSAEAAQAREGLARLNGGRQPNIWHLNGTPPAGDGTGRWNGAARKARRHKLPTPRNHYRLGGFLAGLVSLLGWLIVAAALFFFIVKFLGWIMRAKQKEAVAPPPPTKQEELLMEIRDLLKQGKTPNPV